jgi:phage recombination protein Bet
MTNTNTNQSALAVMATRLQCDTEKLLGTLKSTVFKGATNEELMALCVVANSYGLNPFTKEVYAFPAKGGGIVPVVSVDGWLRIINSQPQLDGIQFADLHEDGKLVATTCRIYRKDRAHPIEVTEYLAECKRSTEPWKMEHRMLRHKALIQCARVAFGFSGIYDEDESERITQANGRFVSSRSTAPFTPPAKPILGPQVTGDAEEDHIPFELDASGPTSVDVLNSRILNDKLNLEKVEAWLAKNDFPKLGLLMTHEAEEVLGLYEELKKDTQS